MACPSPQPLTHPAERPWSCQSARVFSWGGFDSAGCAPIFRGMARYGTVVVCVLLLAALLWSIDHKARDAGFQNLLERFAASRAGYTNAAAYRYAKAAEQQRKGD
jgi:hypothetical protein